MKKILGFNICFCDCFLKGMVFLKKYCRFFLGKIILSECWPLPTDDKYDFWLKNLKSGYVTEYLNKNLLCVKFINFLVSRKNLAHKDETIK